MNKRVGLAIGGVAAIVATAFSVAALSRPLIVGSCSLEVPDDWVTSGHGALLKEYDSPKAVLDMVMGSEYRRVPSSGSIIVFSRALGKGSQFRSVTQTTPACASLVTARSREAIDSGRDIAKSVTRREPPRPKAE